MYTDPAIGALGTNLRRLYTAYEQDNAVPIRHVYGRGQVVEVTPDSWTDHQLADCAAFDEQECNERGITIVHYGGVSRDLDADGYRNIEELGLWDVPCPDEDAAFDISEPLRQTYNGEDYVVGEMQPRVLYYAALVANQVAYMDDWRTTLTEHLDAARELVGDNRDFSNREKFEVYTGLAHERLLRDVRERVQRFEINVDSHQTALTTALQTLTTLKAECDALASTGARSPESWASMWDTLEAHPRITSLDFVGRKLVIVTDDVDMEHIRTGEKRWLGRFKITHDLQAMSVKFENLDNPRGGRPHPHVSNGGEACFGQLSSTFAKIYQDGDLVLLFEHELVYLESFNETDDYGRYAAYWFDVEDARPTTDETTEVATEEVAA